MKSFCSVLHEDLFGDRSEPCYIRCDLGQQNKGLQDSAAMLLVTGYKTVGTGAGPAVFVPLECIFGFRSRPCCPCRRRNI